MQSRDATKHRYILFSFKYIVLKVLGLGPSSFYEVLQNCGKRRDLGLNHFKELAVPFTRGRESTQAVRNGVKSDTL